MARKTDKAQMRDFMAPDRTAQFAAFAEANIDHPYLTQQPVGAHAIKQDADKLLIPICVLSSGQVVGWEEIYRAGENGETQWKKRTAPGTPKKGNGFLVGTIKDDVILIAEGYRTAASIFECSGYGCYVAFGSANIGPLAAALRMEFPQHRIVLCGDADEVGKKVATEAAQAINGSATFPKFAITLGNDTKDFNDLHFYAGAQEVKRQIDIAISSCVRPAKPLLEPEPIEFPWKRLRAPLVECLYQLADSCGSSPDPLVGFSGSILASVLGRSVLFSLTESHHEKAILWNMDIRESGTGKTPALELLKTPLRERQLEAKRRHKQKMELWRNLPKKEQIRPPLPRVYFTSNTTIEGLRDHIDEHGGLLCCFEEGSSFISGQNQYKSGKGSDREDWLTLYDGNMSVITRKGEVYVLDGPRVSLIGGTQPHVFRHFLQKDKELLMLDGTLFRFLLTYESQPHYRRSRQGWSLENQQYWNSIINRASDWANNRQENYRTEFGGEAPLYIPFEPEARELFFETTERMLQERFSLDVSGNSGLFKFSQFIPKAATAIVRLSGLLHVFYALDDGIDIDKAGPIKKETVQGAIEMVLFYLGQAAELFAEVFAAPKEKSNSLSDSSQTQAVLRKTLLVKESDSSDSFSLEEIFKEKEKVTIEEIGNRYREKTNNNIKNESIGKYLKSLGFIINRTSKYRYISSSDYFFFLEKTVTTVTDDINIKRLRILNEWKDWLENCHRTVTHPKDTLGEAPPAAKNDTPEPVSYDLTHNPLPQISPQQFYSAEDYFAAKRRNYGPKRPNP